MNAIPLRHIPLSAPAEAAIQVLSAWQRDYLSRDWHRSRARVLWGEARMIARHIKQTGWRLNQDQVDALQEERRDYRVAAAEHVRKSKGSAA